MAAGRIQKGSKNVTTKTSRLTGADIAKVDVSDKVGVTVQPDCSKVSLPKEAHLTVSPKIHTDKSIKGDGTDIVDFMIQGDGIETVDFHGKGTGTDIVNFLRKDGK